MVNVFPHDEQRAAGGEHFVRAAHEMGADDVFVARQIKGKPIAELFENQGRTLRGLGLSLTNVGVNRRRIFGCGNLVLSGPFGKLQVLLSGLDNAGWHTSMT